MSAAPTKKNVNFKSALLFHILKAPTNNNAYLQSAKPEKHFSFFNQQPFFYWCVTLQRFFSWFMCHTLKYFLIQECEPDNSFFLYSYIMSATPIDCSYFNSANCKHVMKSYLSITCKHFFFNCATPANISYFMYCL